MQNSKSAAIRGARTKLSGFKEVEETHPADCSCNCCCHCNCNCSFVCNSNFTLHSEGPEKIVKWNAQHLESGCRSRGIRQGHYKIMKNYEIAKIEKPKMASHVRNRAHRPPFSLSISLNTYKSHVYRGKWAQAVIFISPGKVGVHTNSSIIQFKPNTIIWELGNNFPGSTQLTKSRKFLDGGRPQRTFAFWTSCGTLLDSFSKEFKCGKSI